MSAFATTSAMSHSVASVQRSVRVSGAAGLRPARFICPGARPLVAGVSNTRKFFNASTLKVQAVKQGESLSDFPGYFTKLTSSTGKTVSLSSFKGKQPVVLFFYPKAGTPGCTKEVQKFRDDYQDFKKLGAAVFGISGDSLEEQKAFANAQKLPYPLLVDAGDALRKGLGVKADFFGALPGRQTFVIAKDGTCLLSYNNQLGAEKHAGEALKALENAKETSKGGVFNFF